MSSVRSLSSGVSGMLTNQLSMDVTANNLANATTPGFKGSRVNFANNLVQTEFAGSAPGNNLGGTNPLQVGLGVTAGSIQVDMSQGALQSTGRTLDLAVQGQGFFEVTDGVRAFYTRVGNFGLDANNDLVHLGTGYRVIGDTYNLTANPDGTQNIDQVGVPLNIPVEDAFPPQRTENVEFQGNLDSATPALRGSAVQSLFQIRDTSTGSVATETSLLRELDLFNAVTPIPAAGTTRTMTVYGTKPDGTTYAGILDLHPWNNPVAGDNRGTVGELVEKFNDVFAQGGTRFGAARVENGNLVINAVGDGDGFAVFFGETTDNVDFSGAAPAINASADSPISGIVDMGAPLSQVYAYNPGVSAPITDTIAAGERGLIDPIVYPTGNVDDNLRISVRINGIETGVIDIPATDYTGLPLTQRAFRLSSFPHVQPGDVIEYEVSGTPSGVVNLGVTSFLVDDTDATNLTTDSYGGGANGIPDMFEENSPTDVNAWQYENERNATFDFYRMRAVPETVSSSIEAFDAQGGSHILEARFFRSGTRTDPASGARSNVWDMVVDVDASEGELIDDLVVGIEFDQLGRYTGNVGTTAHGRTLNATNYVGNPSINGVQVDWATTGPTDPADIFTDFGEPLTFSGLTGFGSDSTAAMVDQNGFSDGQLDSLSVSAEGIMIALYTNGISRSLAQFNLVTFRNPAGLESLQSSMWRQTTNSGNPIRRIPGQSSGFITSGALEGANVDVAVEFSRMIVAQRGYQISARVIQTADDMLEELANLLR
ncbi:MAG: flagellar hook-basal body complex protein [Planctomycetota bacterium]|jgi:flagellar hook protein FlgE|nr:flagellar hook-basal body complex protein [Planctomycetota bacterium]